MPADLAADLAAGLRDGHEPDGSCSWADALEAMERYVTGVRAALERGEEMPAPHAVALPVAPLPRDLAPRARVLLAAQRDVEVALRERVGILGHAMRHEPLARRAAISLYLDRSA